ncbi:hypothetical protein GCM10007276_21360 [Agaricicola taiwanensis]|uniref:Uncharacterized protein n=1 Tax=Agaricicola taiwanensis TaxID=591372 RepID=A0A8J3DUW9_9RHOB|nr:hypothetical protein [Agaricicola taiwanensis]GGE43961.1 hypothetical protein GCM10007276_21360 [Agaricicola taiwanensis]
MTRTSTLLAAASLAVLSATMAFAQTSPVPNNAQGEPAPVAEPKKTPDKPAEDSTSGDALPKIESLDTIPPVLEVIDPTVFAVRVVGPWSEGDLQGFSRVVLVAEGDTPKLYVQWVEQPSEGEPNIIATIEIAQVAEEKLVFGDIRVEASQNDASVFLDTRVDVQGFRETYVLNVGAPGRAQFGPATN